MADRVHLALWWGAQSAPRQLARLAGAIGCLPPAVQAAGARHLSVVALDWGEPALIDEDDAAGMPVAAVLDRAREFLHHDDCVAEVEMAWPMWICDGSDWREAPQPLSFVALGSQFAAGAWREQGHLRVELGQEETFLASAAPWDEAARRHVQSNILKLFGLLQRLETELKPLRRALSSESAPDWSPQLLERLQDAYILPHDASPSAM